MVFSSAQTCEFARTARAALFWQPCGQLWAAVQPCCSMGHGQGGNKGGGRRAAAPPRRSAPAANTGPTITEKIAARKAPGGAESWDDFKAKLKEKQLAQHQTDNHWEVLAAQHREVLDREREARLAAVRGVTAALKQSDKERKSDKEKRKTEKHKGKKHRKERLKDKRHKVEKHSGSKRERRDDASDDSSDDEVTAKPSEPVRVGQVLATGSSDESDGSAADADAARGTGTATAAGGGKADGVGCRETAAAASTSASPAAAASATAATAATASAAAPTALATLTDHRRDQPPHQVEAQLRRAALASIQLSFDVRRDGAASFGLGCEPRGGLLVVREVERGSAAEAAGLQPGHTIVKLRDLHRKLPADAPGEEVVMSSASMQACVELIRLSQFCRFVVRRGEGG